MKAGQLVSDTSFLSLSHVSKTSCKHTFVSVIIPLLVLTSNKTDRVVNRTIIASRRLKGIYQNEHLSIHMHIFCPSYKHPFKPTEQHTTHGTATIYETNSFSPLPEAKAGSQPSNPQSVFAARRESCRGIFTPAKASELGVLLSQENGRRCANQLVASTAETLRGVVLNYIGLTKLYQKQFFSASRR